MPKLLVAITLCMFCNVVAAQFPVGRYVTQLDEDEWMLSFTAAEVSVFKNGEQVILSDYRVSENEIEFSNDRGVFACVGGVSSGKYRWRFQGVNLTFTNLNDECPGRISVLTSNLWRLKETVAAGANRSTTLVGAVCNRDCFIRRCMGRLPLCLCGQRV